MISHYYLQRAETRTERHQGNWADYATEVGTMATARSASLAEWAEPGVTQRGSRDA